MKDSDVVSKIQDLVNEEHELRSSGDAVERSRLERLETELDRCWDLLRQRRAKREFSQDPDAAEARSAGTVEDYQQ
jgi:hypothetical protein